MGFTQPLATSLNRIPTQFWHLHFFCPGKLMTGRFHMDSVIDTTADPEIRKGWTSLMQGITSVRETLNPYLFVPYISNLFSGIILYGCMERCLTSGKFCRTTCSIIE